MRMLHVVFSVFGECQVPPIGLEYELQFFRLFSVDPCGLNNFETMPRKTEKKKSDQTFVLVLALQQLEWHIFSPMRSQKRRYQILY